MNNDKPVSPKQLAFIRNLLDTRVGHGVLDIDAFMVAAAAMTMAQASKVIETLLTLDKAGAPAADASAPAPAAVHAGRYALVTDGVVKFYKVDCPDKGKWAGWVFVKAIAGPDEWPVKGAAGKAIVARIAEDPMSAMALYGREIGQCGHCGRRLTSAWRKVGIGPVCAGKAGYTFPDGLDAGPDAGPELED